MFKLLLFIPTGNRGWMIFISQYSPNSIKFNKLQISTIANINTRNGLRIYCCFDYCFGFFFVSDISCVRGCLVVSLTAVLCTNFLERCKGLQIAEWTTSLVSVCCWTMLPRIGANHIRFGQNSCDMQIPFCFCFFLFFLFLETSIWYVSILL